MLSFISWKQYFIFLLIANFLYYGLVWLLFYKGRISFQFANANFRQAEDSPDEILSTAQHVIDELRPLFADRNSKAELLYTLKINLKKYAAWNEPGFRETINDFIRQESENKCSIRLGEDDQRGIWT
jgi:hypothetical protein